jgi:tyrosyl-tRNA synthetase
MRIQQKLFYANCWNQFTFENIIYELWFSIAESIFKRVCDATELNQEQIDALKREFIGRAYIRPEIKKLAPNLHEVNKI